MDNKKLLNKMMTEEKEELSLLKKQFEEGKIKKDYDQMAKTAEEIYNLTSDVDINDSYQHSRTELIKKISAMKQEKKKKFPKIAYRVAACAAALLIGLNVYTVSAYNENIFSFAIQYTKDSVIVNFNKKAQEDNRIFIPISPEDPYGIKAQLEEVGLKDFEIPYYLPDGFILTEFEHDDNNLRNYLCFVYMNGKQLINLTFEEYHNQIPENIGIPSDEYNISEIEICGHTAVMSREDNQMNVLCMYNKKMIGIFTQDVPYDECDKILNSYK